MAYDEVTIRLASKEQFPSVRSFMIVVNNTLAILREVDKQISEQRNGSLKWRIKDVSFNSPLEMTIFGEPLIEEDYGRAVVRATAAGVRELDRSSDAIPHFFTVSAMNRAKDLVGVLNNGIERVTLAVLDELPVVPTQRVAANVGELVRTYDELTSFQGRLEAVTIHGKRIFHIWDPFDGRIACRFSEAQLFAVRDLLAHRVSVYGRATFTKGGKPLYIEVEEITRLPEQHEVRSVRTYAPINITGGMSSHEYIRSIRDGE